MLCKVLISRKLTRLTSSACPEKLIASWVPSTLMSPQHIMLKKHFLNDKAITAGYVKIKLSALGHGAKEEVNNAHGVIHLITSAFKQTRIKGYFQGDYTNLW